MFPGVEPGLVQFLGLSKLYQAFIEVVAEWSWDVCMECLSRRAFMVLQGLLEKLEASRCRPLSRGFEHRSYPQGRNFKFNLLCLRFPRDGSLLTQIEHPLRYTEAGLHVPTA